MNKSGFTPVGKGVLVGPTADEPAQDHGGIVIPDKVGVGPHVYKCLVHEIGSEVTKCKKGDVVILPLCGYELFLNKEAYRVCLEEHILGVLEERSILAA